MVAEVRADYPSEWAAIGAVAQRLGDRQYRDAAQVDPPGPRSIGCVNLIWPDLLLRPGPTWVVVALAGRDCSTLIGHEPAQRAAACRARRRQVPAARSMSSPRPHVSVQVTNS
jgi:hypothetical protein